VGQTKQINLTFTCRVPGDDWGVFISGNANPDNRVTVELHLPPGQKAGRDARAVVRAPQVTLG
jgi:hypothetical protein